MVLSVDVVFHWALSVVPVTVEVVGAHGFRKWEEPDANVLRC